MNLVFDIGGSKMRFAFTESKDSFEDPIIIENPGKFSEALEEIRKIVSGKKIEKAGGGITGIWNEDRSELLRSPNLQDWISKPVKKELEKILEAPVIIENDSANVGLGEAVFGAGKGYNSVVYMTVSTGVGGAKIIGGQIDQSTVGFEPGHQVIDIEGEENLTLENIVSGTAMSKRTGKKAYETPQDDPIWEELAKKLAIGVRNSIAHWSPDAFVLGGSMIVGDPAISVESVKQELNTMKDTFPKLPDIKKAELGDVGGLYGGLVLLYNK